MLHLPLVREQNGPSGYQHLICGWVWRHVMPTICSCCWQEAERSRGGEDGVTATLPRVTKSCCWEFRKSSPGQHGVSLSLLSETKETASSRMDSCAGLKSLQREGLQVGQWHGDVSLPVLTLALSWQLFLGLRGPKTSGSSRSPENHVGRVTQSSIWLKLLEHQLDHSDSENGSKQSK